MFSINEIKQSYPELPVHSKNVFAQVEIEPERLEALKLSILSRGVVEKIILVEENGQLTIFNGHNRYKCISALYQAGLLWPEFDPNIEIWDNIEELEILSAEMHLYTKVIRPSHAAVFAAKYLVPGLSDEAAVRKTLGRGNKAVDTKGRATEIAAKMVGCGERLICAAKAGIEAIPETATWILKNQMTAIDAENLAKFHSQEAQNVIIKALEKGKTFTTAMQKLTHQSGIANDIETRNREQEKLSFSKDAVVDITERLSAPNGNNLGQDAEVLSSPAYTKLLTKECSESEAQGQKLLFELHDDADQESREGLALVLAKNGFCKVPTVIKVKTKYFLIKEQPDFDKYVTLPDLA